jgi:hypothetical protein
MQSEIEACVDGVTRDGYHVWRSFLDAERCARLGDEAGALLRSDAAQTYPRSIRVWELYRHGSAFVDVLCDERLCDAVTHLLGVGAIVSDFSLNRVVRGGRPDRWHIDYPYNEMDRLVSGSLLGLQCIMPLSPFDASTGATEFAPRRHATPSWPPETLDGEQTEVFVAQPGDLLVLAAASWHRAGTNRTDRPRTAILSSFVERWIRPMIGPPEPGPWGATQKARILLGIDRLPEEMPLDGVPA